MPRLRVFAGPNGSGKSTIKNRIDPVLDCALCEIRRQFDSMDEILRELDGKATEKQLMQQSIV